VNSEMHFEAVIEQVWLCNRRLRLSELRDSLRGRSRWCLEECWEVAELEAVDGKVARYRNSNS
jgi:hypothetical protein